MKKQSLLTIVFSILIAGSLLAQFDKGDKLFNAGIGLNTRYSGSVPVVASFEYGITDVISIGAGMDFISTNYGIVGANYGYSVFTIGARGSYHLNKLLNLNIERLDTYCGGSIGYRAFNWKDNSFTGQPTGNTWGSGLAVMAHAGARYYFTPMIGVFAEVVITGGVSLNGGLAFKF